MNFLSKLFSSFDSNGSKNPEILQVDTLENRQLLSTVPGVDGSTLSVFVEGSTGDEAFTVSYQGEQLAFFSGQGPFNSISTDGLQEFQFFIEDDPFVTGDDIRIDFLNDVNQAGYDRNLRVDRIEINDRAYFTEAASSRVFSTGTWRPEDGVVDGIARGDTLHANGYFQFALSYAAPTQTTLISFDAKAVGLPDTFVANNSVDFELQINGETVDRNRLYVGESSFPSEGTFVYRAQGDVRAEDVRIVFNNDRYTTDPVTGEQVDTNLQVTEVRIGKETFDPNQSNVFSTGTWLPEDGIADGFGRGNVLNGNGYFSFSSPRETTRIDVEAYGAGAEFDILIDDVVVDSFTTRSRTRLTDVYTFVADGDIAPDRIKIAFKNDLLTDDFDRNLTIDEIRVGPNLVYDPLSSNRVFSTGTWLPEDGVSPGFGRGTTLHANGFMSIDPDREVGPTLQFA